jgi:hypothetical protein
VRVELNVGSQSVGFERDGNIAIGGYDTSSIEDYSINIIWENSFRSSECALVR